MIRSPTVKKMLVAMEKWDAGNCLSDTLPKKWWEVIKTWKGSRAAGILQRYKSSIVFSYYGAFVCMQDTIARTRSRLKSKQPSGQARDCRLSCIQGFRVCTKSTHKH